MKASFMVNFFVLLNVLVFFRYVCKTFLVYRVTRWHFWIKLTAPECASRKNKINIFVKPIDPLLHSESETFNYNMRKNNKFKF